MGIFFKGVSLIFFWEFHPKFLQRLFKDCFRKSIIDSSVNFSGENQQILQKKNTRSTVIFLNYNSFFRNSFRVFLGIRTPIPSGSEILHQECFQEFHQDFLPKFVQNLPQMLAWLLTVIAAGIPGKILALRVDSYSFSTSSFRNSLVSLFRKFCLWIL